MRLLRADLLRTASASSTGSAILRVQQVRNARLVRWRRWLCVLHHRRRHDRVRSIEHAVLLDAAMFHDGRLSGPLRVPDLFVLRAVRRVWASLRSPYRDLRTGVRSRGWRGNAWTFLDSGSQQRVT